MTDRGHIGIIHAHRNPREIIERTALSAVGTCRRQLENEQRVYSHHDHHGNHNPRRINSNIFELGSVSSNQDAAGVRNTKPPKTVLDGNIEIAFSYIPDHIEYILYKPLEMRSVMFHGGLDPTSGELRRSISSFAGDPVIISFESWTVAVGSLLQWNSISKS